MFRGLLFSESESLFRKIYKEQNKGEVKWQKEQ